ncbi:MAG: glycosyltransferase family 39 protein [Acidimicrobiales bacterium]
MTDHRVASTLFGFALILGLGLFVRRLAGDVAVVAASACRSQASPMRINDTMGLSEGMYQPFVVLVLWAGYEWIRTPSRRNIVILGVTMALASLIRAEAISLLGFMVVPLVWWVRHLDRAEKLRQTVLCGVAALLVLSPWLIYNNLRFEKPVTLSAVSGTVMMAGACDEAWSGESLGPGANCRARLGGIERSRRPWRDVDDPGCVVYDESVRDEFNRKYATSSTAKEH